jgi:hypothetical protein
LWSLWCRAKPLRLHRFRLLELLEPKLEAETQWVNDAQKAANSTRTIPRSLASVQSRVILFNQQRDSRVPI